MHEFELGIWKSIFMHLVCMLVSLGGSSVQRLNEQYAYLCVAGMSVLQYFTVPLVVHTDSARTARTTRNPSKVRTESVWSPNKFRTVLVESADSLSRLYSVKFYNEFFHL
jgi:hypothetical protein